VAPIVVKVQLGARGYDVVVTPAWTGLGARVAALGSRRCALVTDTDVGPLHGAAVRAELAGAGLDVLDVAVPAGEAHKTVETWWSIVDALIAGRVDRRTPVVALGGGVTGDLAGFAAASVLRGVPLVQLPTTLLAMVDSSVGGKTGFNHPKGKNLVGAFHQPSLVWAALDTLRTLPARERAAGLGEVVKTALLGDATLLDAVERDATRLRDGDPDALAPVIARCVAIKAAVVAADEREEGPRAVLNAGHTYGHALEAVLGFGTLLHGEAVALGLVEEARWAIAAGVCAEPGLADRLAGIVGALGLPTRSPQVDRDALVAAMALDKKGFGDRMRLPLPVRSGRVDVVDVPRETLAGWVKG
jgi:3-dehydroquinate synthase